MSLAQLIIADIRLVILRCLQEDPGYSLNESVLHSALSAIGHKVSRDLVRSQMDWLAEQGFIKIEHVFDVKVATLTKRGEDVACGRCITTGVKRPGPED